MFYNIFMRNIASNEMASQVVHLSRQISLLLVFNFDS